MATEVSSPRADSPAEKKEDEPKKMMSAPPPASEAPGEGVEVVLDPQGTAVISDSPERPTAATSSNQNVFRSPQAVRPRAMRAAGGHGYPPHQQQQHPYASGSWGYPHAPHGEYGPPPPPPPYPVPVPSYNHSGSFDEAGSYHHRRHPGGPPPPPPPHHYSPHVHYPHAAGRGRYPNGDVNVVSPNHKAAEGYPHHHPPHPHTYHPHPPHHAHHHGHHPPPRPPMTPQPPHYGGGAHPRSYYQYPPTSPVSRPGSSGPAAPPRVHQYAMRRGEQQQQQQQQQSKSTADAPPQSSEGPWRSYPPNSAPSSSTSGGPPIVNESSFDSGLTTRETGSAPPTPHSSAHGPRPPPPPPSGPDAFYGGGGSWGSFDSAAPLPPPPDDGRYYGYQPPPESPYAAYSIPHADSFPPPPPPYGVPYSLSYDETDEQHRMGHEYHADGKGGSPLKKHSRKTTGTPVTSNKQQQRNSQKQDMLLPKAAEEVDFEVTDPPTEPILPPGTEPSCESLADVNGYDVLCGRGGGTNSQVGNRRFRKLVQDFQPTYLLARRKEKPLLARTIVLIIRKRGGRFLKKDEETGALFDVGDTKAEAKTSQALREGLDVRATKSAASDHLKKKKKKKDSNKSLADSLDEQELSPSSHTVVSQQTSQRPPESPPTLPRLQGERQTGIVHPHSPEQDQYRKRRRMRSACAPSDKFFPDFCPPRADIRGGDEDDDDDDDVVQGRYEHEQIPNRGCAGIALDMVTGAATGSFCLGPTGWRR